MAADMLNGATPPAEWNSPSFNDGAWEVPTDFGSNGDAGNYWQQHMQRPVEEISNEAHWIWTSDGTGHNDDFCRLVSNHKPQDCSTAAHRCKHTSNLRHILNLYQECL